MAVKTTCIKFDKFDVALNFKRIKSIRIKISKTGKISLSLPYFCTQKQAFEILNKNTEWIEKTHSKILENLPNSDEFRLLGKAYKLKFDENIKNIKIVDKEIWTPSLKRLEKYKKDEAKKIFYGLIEKFRPFVGKDINRIVIRNMQTRWGSCNSRKGYINLNLNLIEKPIELIEYVVLHELTHLIYPHHKKSFYDFIASIMPNFRDLEKALNNKNL